MKNNSKNTNTNYKTTNGIQKLPSGSYRVRKMINGTKYDGVFRKRKDASKYLSILNTEASKLKTSK